jgi:uncharacterized protein (TIGR02996 family)
MAQEGAPVTTEDDFHRALDAQPDDWHARLVFADFLQEQDDPRAAGYRALAQQQLCPFVDDLFFWWTTISSDCCPAGGVRGSGCTLPDDWFALVDIAPASAQFKPLGAPGVKASRREVEDAAAEAFARLPAQRQAELLAAPPVPVRRR